MKRPGLRLLLLCALALLAACQAERSAQEGMSPQIKTAPARPNVNFPEGIRALSAQEEEAFLEATASLVCLMLEGGEPSEGATASPELSARVGLALESRAMSLERLGLMLRAYEGQPEARARLQERVAAQCPEASAQLATPFSQSLRLVEAVASRRGPLSRTGGEADKKTEALPDEARVYLDLASRLGCAALEGGDGLAAQRAALLKAQGWEEARWLQAGERWRAEPGVSAALARRLRSCATLEPLE